MTDAALAEVAADDDEATANLASAPAAAQKVRIFRKHLTGERRPYSFKLATMAPCPTLPTNPWSRTMTRELALEEIKAKQAKYVASGYDPIFDVYWARNAPEPNGDGDVSVVTWRLVPWE